MTLEVNQDLGEKGKHSGIVGWLHPRKMERLLHPRILSAPWKFGTTSEPKHHNFRFQLLIFWGCISPLWKTNGRYGRKVIKRKSSTWTSMEVLWICPPAAHQEPQFHAMFSWKFPPSTHPGSAGTFADPDHQEAFLLWGPVKVGWKVRKFWGDLRFNYCWWRKSWHYLHGMYKILKILG